ncbi:AMP-binding protein [Roseococcus sp.]|uniref:AMP-binding protein n=1 Tax=Roseococcus sp. TaxID=2109646 RepID=UPI003BA95BF6
MTARIIAGAVERDGAELDTRGARLAGGLRRLGLREGDVLAVLLRNDAAYADVVLASRVGGTFYCPLNWHFTVEEAAFILRDSGARAILAEPAMLEPLRAALPADIAVLSLGEEYESWLAAQPAYDGPPVQPRAHMGYTSGTTGRPKGVRRLPVPPERQAAQRAAMAEVVSATFGTEPGCRALVSAPLYHSAPSVFVQNALAAGELLVVEPRFDAEQTLALIERHRIEVVYLVPVMYVRLLRLPEEVRRRYDISSLRFVCSTGAPCAPEVKRAMIDWFGPIITETYASTESGMITVATSADALARPGTAGRAVGGAELRILDQADRPLPIGEIGRVFVQQPAYPDFTYHGREEERRAIERDGCISLGDMGYLDAEGFLFLCDRASDMVISGGVNIYPAEIEHALLRLPGVLDCAVFGIPDAEFGERLHAIVQPALEAAPNSDDIAAGLRALIAGYKVPRGIEITAELPRDPNGKIAKRKLREPYWAGRERRI